MSDLNELAQVQQDLKKLLENGTGLGDATRVLFGRGRGMMFLWQAVMPFVGNDATEAKRFVVRELRGAECHTRNGLRKRGERGTGGA